MSEEAIRQLTPKPPLKAPAPATPDQAEVDDDPKRRGTMWIAPLIGVILLAAILFTAPIYGRLTSDGKISPEIDRSAAQVDVLVDLPFEPETFHRETLSDLGVFSGRDREDPTRIRVRAVTPENLEAIANLFWVEGILPN